MIKYIYALRDVKVGFLSPTLHDCDDLAKRDLQNVVRRGTGTLLDTHPEDFTLFRLGSFDTESGLITSELPVHVLEVRDIVQS